MTQILLVEDDDASRKRLERILLDAGWSTVAAAGGRQALRLLAEHRPGLAVVSLEILGGEGAETVSRLRWQRSDLPVLAVTRGPVAPAVLKTARACGASEILIGPMAAEELVAAVRAALEKPADGGSTAGSSPSWSAGPAVSLQQRWK